MVNFNLENVQNYNLSNIGGAQNYNEASKVQIRSNSFAYSTPSINSGAPSQDTFVRTQKQTPAQDNFATKLTESLAVKYAPQVYLSKHMNYSAIKDAMDKNPQIRELLDKSGVPVKINMENLRGKNQDHFITTYQKASEIGANLSKEEQTKLMKAALLHDIGKALIPSEILNKPGALTKEERKIVNLHAELGAEILKAQNVDKDVVEAVLLHHTDCGNPEKRQNKISQILSVADVHSALKEERPYKERFSDRRVREIMQGDNKLNQQFVSQAFTKNKI